MWLQLISIKQKRRIEDMINEPLIIKLQNGKIYAGLIDDANINEDFLCLYNCMLLDEKRLIWKEHDIFINVDGKIERNNMPYFAFSEINQILALQENLIEKYGLYEAIQIYIDPHYKPIYSIKCEGSLDETHSKECDQDLHNALIQIRTIPHYGYNEIGKNKSRKFEQSFDYLRKRLLKMGAKIP